MKMLKVRDLKEMAVKNGGFSLSSNGDSPKSGFMVSIRDILKMPLDLWLELEEQSSINDYSEIAENVNGYIGCWIDNGDVYIDISANIQDKEQALKTAKENNQLAIFDVVNCETIYL